VKKDCAPTSRISRTLRAALRKLKNKKAEQNGSGRSTTQKWRKFLAEKRFAFRFQEALKI